MAKTISDLRVLWLPQHDRLATQKVARAHELLVPTSKWAREQQRLIAEPGEDSEQDWRDLRTGVVGSTT